MFCTTAMKDLTGQVNANTTRRNRKFCEMITVLDVPAGWSYAVKYIKGKGYTHLDEGAKVKQTIQANFQFNNTHKFVEEIEGPDSKTLKTNIVIPDDELVYSPCNEDMYFKFKLSVQASATDGNSAFIAFEKDWREYMKVGLVWKRCQ